MSDNMDMPEDDRESGPYDPMDDLKCFFCGTFFDRGENKNLCSCMEKKFAEYAKWQEDEAARQKRLSGPSEGATLQCLYCGEFFPEGFFACMCPIELREDDAKDFDARISESLKEAAERNLYVVGEQPRPSGSGEAIVDMVKRDLDLRKEFGTEKYGQPLMANNGRSALKDAYEEALDLCCYLRQALAEEND